MWSARWLLWQWIRRDFIVQYRQSLLGLAWSVVQPLLLLALYGVVFVKVLRVHPPQGSYLVFALCGLAPWGFVATALNRSSTSLLTSSTVIRQVYFPRVIVPLASTGVTTIDLALSTAILLIIQAVTAGQLHASTLALIPIYLGLLLLMAAVGIVVAMVAALVRDIRFVIPLLLQIGFIATPIMYPQGLVPHRYAWVYDLNPVGRIIGAVRSAVIVGHWPSAALLVSIVATGAVALGLAVCYGNAVEDRLPDLL